MLKREQVAVAGQVYTAVRLKNGCKVLR